jgi:hypothetical protein
VWAHTGCIQQIAGPLTIGRNSNARRCIEKPFEEGQLVYRLKATAHRVQVYLIALESLFYLYTCLSCPLHSGKARVP